MILKALKALIVGVMFIAPTLVDASVGDSINVFGVLEVQSRSTNTVVSVPWTDLGVDEVKPIRVCDLVLTNNLSVGDTILVYNLDTRSVNQPYTGWVLSGSGWESITTVSTDVVAVAPDAENARVNRGKSFWLRRQRPMEGTEAVPFYLCGQYSADPAESVTITAGTVEAPVYHLLASPSAEDKKLDDLGWKSYNVNSNDTIVVPLNSENGATRLYRFEPTEGDNGRWYYTKTVNRKNQKIYDDVLKAGTGFWYISRGGRMTVRW